MSGIGEKIWTGRFSRRTGLKVLAAVGAAEGTAAVFAPVLRIADTIAEAVESCPENMRLYDVDGGVAFDIVGRRVYSGNWRDGNVLLTLKGNHVRRGQGELGEVLYTFDDDKIHAGDGPDGPVVYRLRRNNIHLCGDPETIYTIRSNTFKEWYTGPDGEDAIRTVFTANRNLGGLCPLDRLLLPVLADKRW